MSTEDNKILTYRLMECWNQGNVALLEEVLALDFIFHDPGSPIPAPGIRNREDYKHYLVSFVTSWQGHFTVEGHDRRKGHGRKSLDISRYPPGRVEGRVSQPAAR